MMEPLMKPAWETFLELRTALARRNIERVKVLLQQQSIKVDINSAEDKIARPIHLAVTLGNPYIVKLLIDKGAYINCQNCDNETPLTLAAKAGNIAVADMLLSVSDQKNCSNEDDITHLHVACMRNCVRVVKQLLLKGADINKAVKVTSANWKGFTPLHFAVMCNCYDTVKFLIHCGADITIKNEEQFTPLHLAFIYFNTRIMDLILFHHKYVIQNPIDSYMLTHFHIACSRNNLDIVQSFITHGADINMKVSEKSVHYKNFRPIHLAIQNRCVDVIKLLLAYDVDLKIVDGIDPLEFAYDTANEEIVYALQSNILVPKISEVFRNLSNPAVLEEIVTDSLNDREYKSNLTEGQWSYWTRYNPLHLAVKNKNLQIVKTLVKQKLSYITIKDAKGKTPLHLAFESNQMNIVDLILSAHEKIDENPLDSNGLSHFHISCTRNNLQIVERFIKNEPDLNSSVASSSPIWSGYTPLHFASKFKQKDVVKLLLDADADISVKNELKLTAFDIAILNFDAKTEHDKINEISIIELMLLKLSEDKINLFDDRGFSLLHIYCISKDLDFITNYLYTSLKAHPQVINKAVNWSETVYNGCTPLLFLLKFYHGKFSSENDSEIEKLVELFLLNNSNVNVKDVTLSTALHYAKFNEKLTKLLILYGADVNVQNIQGNTPLYYDWIKDEVNLKVLQLLLNSGADINIENEFNNTPFTTISLNTNKHNLCLIMIKHARKLYTIGHPVSQRNIVHYRRWLQDIEMQKIYNYTDFEKECLKEIESLKKHRVTKYSRLYDLMFQNENQLAAHSVNDSLKEMLKSSNFNFQFPNYGSVIKVQFRKGMERRLLLESAKKSLNFFSNHFNLVDDCMEHILKYLPNDNLQIIDNGEKLQKKLDYIL